jgi:uroporphyrinogen decarboxylase
MDNIKISTHYIKSLLEGKPVNRVPRYHFMLGFCAKNVGFPIKCMYTNPEKSFLAQAWTFEQYGIEGWPEYGYASYGGWEFGGNIKFPESEWEQAPSHGSFAVKSEEHVPKLRMPDVKKAGALPLAMEFSRLQDKYDTPISVILGGNFTIAGNICPVETLCRWTLKKPDLAHQLLRMATDHMVEVVQLWADTFGAERVIPNIWEPLASNQIISPKQFAIFAFPYLKEFSTKCLAMGIKHLYYHICGVQKANLQYWEQIPMGDPGMVSFGHQVDLETAIKYFGDKCIIIGNIDPTIIQMGTPQQVYKACKEAIEIGKTAPKGFLLMEGCELPPMAPPVNSYMMTKAVNDFGWYK